MSEKKENKSLIYFILRFIPICLFLTLMFFTLFMAFIEKYEYNILQSDMQNVSLEFESVPFENPSEDIKIAIALFSIEIPEDTQQPIYDSKLFLRGLTIGDSLLKERTVIIGKEAFISWGILGSTLSHEIEIHSNQSFLKIEILNYLSNSIYNISKFFNFKPDIKFSNYGTYLAEKDAYIYEYSNQKRFHLTPQEKKAIKKIIINDAILSDSNS